MVCDARCTAIDAYPPSCACTVPAGASATEFSFEPGLPAWYAGTAPLDVRVVCATTENVGSGVVAGPAGPTAPDANATAPTLAPAPFRASIREISFAVVRACAGGTTIGLVPLLLLIGVIVVGARTIVLVVALRKRAAATGGSAASVLGADADWQDLGPKWGLWGLHVWVGLVVPFSAHTGVQQALMALAQAIWISAAVAALLFVRLLPLPAAMYFAAALASVTASAVLRPCLHLLFSRHRVIDRRRLYVARLQLSRAAEGALTHVGVGVGRQTAAALATLRVENAAADAMRLQDQQDGGFASVVVSPGLRPAGAGSTPPTSTVLVASGAASDKPESAPAVPTASGSKSDPPTTSDTSALSSRQRRARGAPSCASHQRVSAKKETAVAVAATIIVILLCAFLASALASAWCGEDADAWGLGVLIAIAADVAVAQPAYVAATYLYRCRIRDRRNALGVEEAVAAHPSYPVHRAWLRPAAF
jgi:hypothetical protein